MTKQSMNKMSQIEREFQAIWHRFSSELRTTGGKVEMQVPSATVGNASVLTTVIRICPDLYPSISEVALSIQRAYPPHYFYPLTDMHFTVLNCMAFLSEPEELKADDITRIARRLRDVFVSFKPVAVQLRGLNVFPTTVFIQIFDPAGSISELRHRIRTCLAEDYWNSEMEGKLLVPDPLLSFSNLLRFREAVPTDFVDLVEKYRNKDFGMCQLKGVELVTTDKLLSRENTTVWERYDLPQPRKSVLG
ncbi:MAG TPA: 2'-5' RNA ligase family protein [Pyrinomonadaceae bacterium]|nr:2'-5' RNA ligase family protein [Pyrinomonadaceae bacterium]